MSQPKGYKKIKSYKQGKLAARKGLSRTECPYELDAETKRILLKRHRWLLGYEEVRFRPSKKKKKVKSELKGVHDLTDAGMKRLRKKKKKRRHD